MVIRIRKFDFSPTISLVTRSKDDLKILAKGCAGFIRTVLWPPLWIDDLKK